MTTRELDEMKKKLLPPEQATVEEKAFAYELLLAGEQVDRGKASEALRIARYTLRVSRRTDSTTASRETPK